MANLKKIEACQIAYGDQYAQMVESSATRKKEKKQPFGQQKTRKGKKEISKIGRLKAKQRGVKKGSTRIGYQASKEPR